MKNMAAEENRKLQTQSLTLTYLDMVDFLPLDRFEVFARQGRSSAAVVQPSVTRIREETSAWLSFLKHQAAHVLYLTGS